MSMMLLIVFGFWVPHNKSLVWLTTCAIGIVFGVFIYESVFLFVQNFIFKLELVIRCPILSRVLISFWLQDIGKKMSDIWTAIEVQRRKLYAEFGNLLLRPYFEHLYKPLQKKDIAVCTSLFLISRLVQICTINSSFFFY
jgi:hypothetical protein